MKRLTLILCAVAFICIALGCDKTCSNGVRIGVIQKFSHKGLINDSWEGELAMQGYQSTGGDHPTMSNTWEFSVEDNQTVIDAITKAQESGHRVKLTYRQVVCNGGLHFDTDYRILKVEPLD